MDEEGEVCPRSRRLRPRGPGTGLLNPGPHASLSEQRGAERLPTSPHMLAGCFRAWWEGSGCQLCQAAEEGVPEAGTETKACKADGDRRMAAASPASRGALGSAPFPTSACSAACAQQVCLPFCLRTCPTLRTPLGGGGREQVGLAHFCLCCLFLHPACILSDIIDGVASEGCFPQKQSGDRAGETRCAQ